MITSSSSSDARGELLRQVAQVGELLPGEAGRAQLLVGGGYELLGGEEALVVGVQRFQDAVHDGARRRAGELLKEDGACQRPEGAVARLHRKRAHAVDDAG